MLEAGEATVGQIDHAVRDGGFPMGPFELIDLAGVDVNLAAARGVWDGLGRPDRLAPSPIQEQLVAADRLGRKSGQGFYAYEGGRQGAVADEFIATEGAASPAEIRDRILAAIGAEAQRALDEGVATAADIDLALRLGAGHPQGPFERARSAGR
jgi:3-hydroxybutyryl-CoA dehydrogenase